MASIGEEGTKKKKNSFEVKIRNAIQSAFNFDFTLTNSTVSEDVKSVLVLSMAHEKDRFTVMLTCLGGRTKLPCQHYTQDWLCFHEQSLEVTGNRVKKVNFRTCLKWYYDKNLCFSFRLFLT